MNLALSTDSNYVFQTGVTIYSAVKNNSSVEDIYILGSNLRREDEDFFSVMSKTLQRKIFIVPVRENDVCRVISSDHLTPATFNRLMMDKLLPESVDKILYLDSDIAVIGDITKLYLDSRLLSHTAVVVEGYTSMGRKYIKKTSDAGRWEAAVRCGMAAKRKVGIRRNGKYFNAGVMLINLSKMRQNHIGEKCIAAQKEIGYFDADQGVLNYILKDEVAYAPLKYNCRPDVYAWKWQHYLRKHAAIYHYSQKPWKKLFVAGGAAWWKYAFELDRHESIKILKAILIKRGEGIWKEKTQ